MQSHGLCPQKLFCLYLEVLVRERVIKLKDLFLTNSTDRLFNQCDFPGTLWYKMMLEGSLSRRFVCVCVCPLVGVWGLQEPRAGGCR